jgi:hypothetical protein
MSLKMRQRIQSGVRGDIFQRLFADRIPDYMPWDILKTRVDGQCGSFVRERIDLRISVHVRLAIEDNS